VKLVNTADLKSAGPKQPLPVRFRFRAPLALVSCFRAVFAVPTIPPRLLQFFGFAPKGLTVSLAWLNRVDSMALSQVARTGAFWPRTSMYSRTCCGVMTSMGIAVSQVPAPALDPICPFWAVSGGYAAKLADKLAQWTRHPASLDRDFGLKRFGEEGVRPRSAGRRNGRSIPVRRLRHYPGNPRGTRRLYYLMAGGPEERQARHLLGRQSRRTRHQLFERIAAEGGGRGPRHLTAHALADHGRGFSRRGSVFPSPLATRRTQLHALAPC
jgi:hypothetical protein